MLIVATSLVTGKPLKEAQYLVDAGWDKLTLLKPNVLTIYDSEAQVLQVAQGQATIGGIEYSKAIYPHTAKGLPLDMTFPKEGAFTGINSMTIVKNAPEPELGAAFINRILEPSVAKMLSEQTLSAPSVSGIDFKPETVKFWPIPIPRRRISGSSPRTGISSFRAAARGWSAIIKCSRADRNAHEVGRSQA